VIVAAALVEPLQFTKPGRKASAFQAGDIRLFLFLSVPLPMGGNDVAVMDEFGQFARGFAKLVKLQKAIFP
jgi:hypothetical protein